MDKILVGGSAIQRPVGPLIVVEELVPGECGRHGGDCERAVVPAPELDPGGPVAALDAAVPLGPPGRQDMEGDFQRLAGALEVGHELAAAVDLDGLDGEGHGRDGGFEEALGVAGGGAGEDAGGGELGDGADGAELLEGLAVAAAGHVVDLNHLAGGFGFGLVPVFPSLRPGAFEAAAALGLGAALAEGRGLDPAVGDGLGDDAPDGGDGQADAAAVEHGLQARLAHERVLGPQLEHGPVVGVGPAPLADVFGPGALRREGLEAAAAEGFAPVMVGALGQADGLQRVALEHALGGHLVDEIEDALALPGGLGRGLVHARALARMGAGVQQSHVQAPCSLGEPSMPEPAAGRIAPRRRAMNSGRLRLPPFLARRDLPHPFSSWA